MPRRDVQGGIHLRIFVGGDISVRLHSELQQRVCPEITGGGSKFASVLFEHGAQLAGVYLRRGLHVAVVLELAEQALGMQRDVGDIRIQMIQAEVEVPAVVAERCACVQLGGHLQAS